MGATRNGARQFLNVIARACKLSHMPGFRLGLNEILGVTSANALMAVWEPFCTLIDVSIALDNWFNKKDSVDDDAGGEDAAPGI